MENNPNFLPQDLNKKLKDLGYDGPCFLNSDSILIPDFFRWVRKAHKYHHYIVPCGNHIHYNFDIVLPSTVEYSSLWNEDEKYTTYEEAEISCVSRVIEMIEKDLGYIK